MMEVVRKLLTSRKWLGAIVGVLIPILNKKFEWGLDAETVTQSIAAIAAAILGEAYIDGKRLEGAPPPAPEPPTTAT